MTTLNLQTPARQHPEQLAAAVGSEIEKVLSVQLGRLAGTPRQDDAGLAFAFNLETGGERSAGYNLIPAGRGVWQVSNFVITS